MFLIDKLVEAKGAVARRLEPGRVPFVRWLTEFGLPFCYDGRADDVRFPWAHPVEVTAGFAFFFSG